MLGVKRFICVEHGVEFDDQLKFFCHISKDHDVDLDITKIFNDDRFALSYAPKLKKEEKKVEPAAHSSSLHFDVVVPPPPSLKGVSSGSRSGRPSSSHPLTNGSRWRRDANYPEEEYRRGRNRSPVRESRVEPREELGDDQAGDAEIGRLMVDQLIRENGVPINTAALDHQHSNGTDPGAFPPAMGWDTPPQNHPLRLPVDCPRARKLRYPNMCAICLDTSPRSREDLQEHVLHHETFLAACRELKRAPKESLGDIAEGLWKHAPHCMVCFMDFKSWKEVEIHWGEAGHNSSPSVKKKEEQLEKMCPGCHLVRRNLEHFFKCHSHTCLICFTRFWDKKELETHFNAVHAVWIETRYISLGAFAATWLDKEPCCTSNCSKVFKTWYAAQVHSELCKEDKEEKKDGKREKEGRRSKQIKSRDRSRSPSRAKSHRRSRSRSRAKSHHRSRSRVRSRSRSVSEEWQERREEKEKRREEKENRREEKEKRREEKKELREEKEKRREERKSDSDDDVIVLD